MKRRLLTACALAALLIILGAGVAGAGPLSQSGAPTVVSYQGLVAVDGVPYSGTGHFKFAVVDSGGAIAWSNDGTASGEPASAVSLTVANGLFTVLLGDTSLANMTALPATAFAGTERSLRVWFSSDGSTFTQLSPDRRIAAVPYALQAQEAANAWNLDGNAGTAAGSHFLGTTDGRALELKVNGERALRLEPHATSPNIVGGYSGNGVGAGVYGATIGGGGRSEEANSVSGSYGTVGGGADNEVGPRGDYAAVAGGYRNTASNTAATVAGGVANTASGHAATVAGGAGNTASGSYSFAAGNHAQAEHSGAFVWSDMDEYGTAFSSARANHFAVRARGGVYFATSGDLTAGMELVAGGSAWNSLSDRALKENLVPVDTRALLARLAAIPVLTWNYKAQGPAIRHIGPMAQDFNALLPDLGGEGERYINSLDADGVALAAIQGLYQRSQEQAARIEQLEAENAALREQLAGIEARLAALEQGR